MHPSRGTGALIFGDVTCRDWVTIVVPPEEHPIETYNRIRFRSFPNRDDLPSLLDGI